MNYDSAIAKIIVSQTRSDKQMAIFTSATDKSVDEFVQSHMMRPVRISFRMNEPVSRPILSYCLVVSSRGNERLSIYERSQ